MRDHDVFPRIPLALSMKIILSFFLYATVLNTVLWLTEWERVARVRLPTFVDAMANATAYVILSVLFAPLLVIFWNYFITKAFSCPKIRYTHAILIYFLFCILVMIG